MRTAFLADNLALFWPMQQQLHAVSPCTLHIAAGMAQPSPHTQHDRRFVSQVEENKDRVFQAIACRPSGRGVGC